MTILSRVVPASTVRDLPYQHSDCGASPSDDRIGLARTLGDVYPIILAVAVSAVVLFWRLGTRSLLDWDEAIYAQIAKEMVHTGSWISPHWGYKLWFEKPPLLMWITAILYKIFGINELWSRAASALAGIGVISLTYLMAQDFVDGLSGLLSVLVLFTSFQFIAEARFGTTDVMLTFFTYLAIYAYWKFRAGANRGWYLACASCGLAIMTKGAGGLIAPLVIAILLILDGQLSSFVRQRLFWHGLALAIAIAAPWHIFMLLRYGKQFVDSYVMYHVVQRVLVPIENHPHGRFMYVRVFDDGSYPWNWLVPFALALALADAFRGNERTRSLVLIVVLIFGGYTAVQTGLPWYIVPVYPALAILIGSMLRQAFYSRDTIAFSGLIFGASILVLSASGKIVLACSLAALIALGITWFLRRERMVQVTVIMIAVFFSIVGLKRLGPLYRKAETPIAHLSSMVKSLEPDQHQPIFIPGEPYGTEPGPSALFYSDKPVVNPTSVATLGTLEVPNIKWVITTKSDLPSLSSLFDVRITDQDGPLILVETAKKASKNAGH